MNSTYQTGNPTLTHMHATLVANRLSKTCKVKLHWRSTQICGRSMPHIKKWQASVVASIMEPWWRHAARCQSLLPRSVTQSPFIDFDFVCCTWKQDSWLRDIKFSLPVLTRCFWPPLIRRIIWFPTGVSAHTCVQTSWWAMLHSLSGNSIELQER